MLEVLRVGATEFKVFALAWGECFGARPEERVIERYFSRDMPTVAPARVSQKAGADWMPISANM